MKREERKKYKDYYLFDFDEMLNAKLERWESIELNGRKTPSLVYSLVIDMFRFIGDTREETEILDECYTVKGWYKNHSWTKTKYDEWKSTRLVPIIRKRMGLSKEKANREASWFMLEWSFMIEDE